MCLPLIKVQILESLTYQRRLKKYTEDYLGNDLWDYQELTDNIGEYTLIIDTTDFHK